MTDRDNDEEASGVPEGTERTDSGRYVTDSGRHNTDPGRHITNRNVVVRGAPGRDDSGPREVRLPGSPNRGGYSDDAFDVVTPIQPLPRDVYDEADVTLSHHDEPEGESAQAQAQADAERPRAPGEIRGRDLVETAPGRRRVLSQRETDLLDRALGRDPGRTVEVDRDLDQDMLATAPGRRRRHGSDRDVDPAGSSERPSDPRIGLSRRPPSGAEHAAEAAEPGERPSDPRLVLPAPRRAPTDRGHVEPRRHPITPPPLPRDHDPDAEPTERLRSRRPSWKSGRPNSAETRVAPPPALDRSLRAVVVLAVLGLGAAGLALPGSALRGGIAWLAFLFFVLTGWGTIVSRAAKIGDPDGGLRAALGAAGYLAAGGVLLAAGVLNRPAVLGLIGIGAAAFAWHEMTAPIAIWHRIRDGVGFLRARPALGAFVAVVVALAVVRLIGAVAALDASPWDDDVAYTAFIRRLLDAGNLVEPFSFRRLGAYGGQTVLQALAGARGTLANVHMIDRGLALGVALLLIVGHARERRTQPLWLALIALVLLILPDTAVNTASFWTGPMLFLALYRCIVRDHWTLVGLVAAATVTLRQSFLVPVGVLVACVLIARLVGRARSMPWRDAWRQDRWRWRWSIGIAAAVIIPWWIAAYRSSHTFLFPVFAGTWNHDLSLSPGVTTWTDELALLVRCCLDTAPFAVIPILALVLPFTSDRRPGRPLTALIVASLVGFVALVHGFLGSEPFHIWRYAFGFSATLAAMLVLEIGADPDGDGGTVELAPLGRWIVLAAFALQLLGGRGQVVRQATALFGDMRATAAIDRHGDPADGPEPRRYARMQAAIPAGARVVVMLDDPALLDYRRNRIANLDNPGFASPGPQLPAFHGAEAMREYLVNQGYRFAAFVRAERSRYCFRREFWIERMFTDAEIFQVMSAYALDAIDGFAELATTTTVVYDADGLVVLDLASPLYPAKRRSATGDEPTRRAAWTREFAEREHLLDAWALTNRADVRFEDGFGRLRFIDGSIDDPKWYEISHSYSGAKRGTAALVLLRRAHMRVKGDGPRRLTLGAAIALNTTYTHPRLDISLDGEPLASVVADASGKYAVDVTVPGDRLAGDRGDRGWHDLYLVFSSLADPEIDVRDVRIARLESLSWAPP